MKNRITRDALSMVASVAKISLNDQERDKYVQEINDILEYAEKFDKVEVSKVEPFINPMLGYTLLRKDEVKPSLSQQEVLQSAKNTEAGHFKVPKTIEEN